MATRKPREEFYWLLGRIGYGSEVRDFFPEEAELIGVLTILWNVHEKNLRSLFVRILGGPHEDYVAAIWDRMPTHHARRGTLALALEYGALDDKQAALLTEVIDRTKRLADRRNTLIHAEFVVKSGTEQLFAKSRPPNSSKPAIHQKTTKADLAKLVTEVEELITMDEALSVSLLPPDLVDSVRALAGRRFGNAPRPLPQNPQSGSPRLSEPQSDQPED